MSVDAWAVRAPSSAQRLTDLGETLAPIGEKSQVVRLINTAVSGIQWDSSGTHGVVDHGGGSLEIDLGQSELVRMVCFAMHRGSGGVLEPLIAAVLRALDLRVADESGTFVQPKTS